MKLEDDVTILQVACVNKMDRLVKEIVDKQRMKINRKHLEYTPNGKFENNAIMSLINLNMLDTFKLIIEKYFINSGKIIPEDENSHLGKYLIHCHKLGKEEFTQVLLENVVFSSKLMKLVRKQIKETSAPKSVHMSSVIPEVSVSKPNMSKVDLVQNPVESDNCYEMSEILNRIKEVVVQEKVEATQ
jgi:hypothetical protein